MAVNFLDYFNKDDYDKKNILKSGSKKYSVKDLKETVFSKVLKLNQISNKNIMLPVKNNRDFIFNFLACIFAKKNIYLYNDNSKANVYPKCAIFSDEDITPVKTYKFENINPEEISISFLTSGTTSSNKLVRKTLQNLLFESYDLIKEFKFKPDLEYVTSTTLNHLFCMTFYLFLPLNSGGIINVEPVLYPENLVYEDVVFVTTPSFLEQVKKSDFNPALCKLNKIISAGSKLNKEVFDFANTLVKEAVIDIYGSTETGVIAYRTRPLAEMKLFLGVKLLEINSEQTKIKTNYSPNDFEILGDEIKENNGYIKLLSRKDNILKIHEKRVCAADLEDEICKNKFIAEAFCFALSDKIACMATLNNSGISYIKENGIVKFIKLLNKEISGKFEQIPKKWKFINSIPKTANGKIDKDKIKKIFDLNISMPLILNRARKENEALFELYFYKNCNFFKGHFENFPILAGVAQLFFASFFAEFAFNIPGCGGQYKKIKFSRLIYPDEEITLKLSKEKSGISYSYIKEDTILSSGLMPYKNIYKEENNEN